MFEPQVGRSAALNAGIKAAAGEIIANTDDDVRFEPDWLQQAAGVELANSATSSAARFCRSGWPQAGLAF